MQIKDCPVQSPESLPHPDRTLSPVIFGLKHLQPVTRFPLVQIAPNHSADQGLPCTATRKLTTPRQDTLPCDLRTQTSSTSDQVSPIQIAPNHSADQGLPCTATRKLATPRQDTLTCDLRTQTSSTVIRFSLSKLLQTTVQIKDCPVQPPESLPHPDRTLSPVIFRLKHPQPVTRFSPVQIVPNHAGQGLPCAVTRKLAAPRQDTLPCDLRTQTSSTSDQVFPCPNCSKPCRSRIALYSHQKACHTQTRHSPL